MEERERGDLDPRDGDSYSGGMSMSAGDEDDGEQDGDDAREVLRLGERLEHSGRLVRAEVVEDGEVEDLQRQQRGGQAEQLSGGTAGELSCEVVMVCFLLGWGLGETDSDFFVVDDLMSNVRRTEVRTPHHML